VITALSGQFIAIFSQDTGGTVLTFSVIGIATGILTLLTLPVFVIVDLIRKGAFTSMILTELITSTILWVLYLTTGALASHAFVGITGCSSLSVADGYPANAETACQDGMAVEALSFLSMAILIVYSFVLLVFTFIATSRGNNVWTSSVKDTNFFAPTAEPKSEFQPGYPPQQVTYTTTPSAAFGTPPVGTQHMYPNYHTGTPIPQQGIPFQGGPMPVQGGPLMAPQSTGTLYQLPMSATPPPQQQSPYAQV
jgi:hypothetical protein